MDKIFEKCLIAAVTLLLPSAIILTSMEATALNAELYGALQEKYGVEDVVGTDLNELGRINESLVKYLRGRTDSLDMKAEIGGESVEVFGQREKAHMVDVKSLFMGGFYLRNVLLALTILFLYLLYFAGGKSIAKPGQAILYSGFAMAAFSSIIAFMIFTDFQKYFIAFHEIFFTNDLWMLDPETDILIQMLPIEFFVAIVKRTAYVFIAQYALVLGLAYLVVRRGRIIKK
ncbi:MAG TPA: TIGR01906 family membrane protein [Clostridia bacterium]|nr:TIGR01906 family membrane protein [Clostridia bacterium]